MQEHDRTRAKLAAKWCPRRAEFRWKTLHELRGGYLRSRADLRNAVEFVLSYAPAARDPLLVRLFAYVDLVDHPEECDLFAMRRKALGKAMS